MISEPFQPKADTDQGGTLEKNGTLTGSGTFTGDGEITGTKLTQATPNAGEGYAINCTTEQITIESGYRISSDKSDPLQLPFFSSLLSPIDDAMIKALPFGSV